MSWMSLEIFPLHADYAMDKVHTLKAISLASVDAVLQTPDEFVPPPEKKFNDEQVRSFLDD